METFKLFCAWSDMVRRGWKKPFVLIFAIDGNASRGAVQSLPYLQQNAVAIVPPLAVPKAQHCDASRLKKLLTRPIVFLVQGMSMLESIQFDTEFGGHAVEIEEENSNWMLSSKLKSGKSSSAKTFPELLLLFGLIASEYAGRLLGLHAFGVADTRAKGNRENVQRIMASIHISIVVQLPPLRREE